MTSKKRVLIACEESQAVTIAFRKLGCEAFSCDLMPCSGGHPEWHYCCDIFEVINDGWDLMIAHPPCTFLSSSGSQWLSHPDDKHLPFEDRRPNPRYPNRRRDMLDSIEFVKKLWSAPIDRIAIENPIGLLSTRWMKPTQIIQPWMFGDKATKATCLWLKNLDPLVPAEIVNKGERVVFKSSKSQPKWYSNTPMKERRKLRSKTFDGIAMAFAQQWSKSL